MASARPRKPKKTLRDTITEQVTGVSVESGEPLTEEAQVAQEVQKWTMELQDSDKFLEKWHSQGDKTVRRFLDDEGADANTPYPTYRLNLFYSNIVTMKAILFAKLPKVEADRRFLDPSDDVARVASEMVTRILQNDLNSEDDATGEVLKNALQDRLIPGYGGARIRYCMEEKDETKADEWCDVVYTHWKDVRWSPCRTYEEVRWKAYRSYMTKEEVETRFGEDVAKAIPYASSGPELNANKHAPGAVPVPASKQAEVWEIWDKTSKCVYWYVSGYMKFLDKQENPLELKEFFPDARPMVSNTTTSRYVPKPDYAMAQDLYTEIDVLETRIALLTAAAKCVGVYDRQSGDVQRVFTEGVENQLIPVDNWALFAEKGGLKGVMDFVPLEAVVNAIQVLTQQQQSRIQQLYQVTGMSDILRGQATAGGVTATEQKIKAQFGSTRMQAIQEELGNFAQDLLNKKVQLIRKFYDPQRILELSNILNTPDAELAPQAIELIKSPTDQFDLRVAVRSDTMAQVDYDSLKMERTEYLQATSQFLGQSMPLIEQHPESAPFLLQLLRFGLSAFKGGNEIEGVIDQFTSAVEEKLKQAASQPPPPNPEMQKMQMEMQMAQQEGQQKAQLEQQKMQMDMQKMQQELDIEKQKAALEIQKMQMELQYLREKYQMEAQQKQADSAIKLQTAQQGAEIKQADMAMTLQGKAEDRQFQREAAVEDRVMDRQAAVEDRKFEVKARQEDRVMAKQEAKDKAAMAPKPGKGPAK